MTSMLLTRRYDEAAGVLCSLATAAEGAAGGLTAARQSSFEQSHIAIFFSAAYLPATSSTILRTIARSPAMNGVTCLKPVPSQRWNLTMPEPSWSEQLVLIGGKSP